MVDRGALLIRVACALPLGGVALRWALDAPPPFPRSALVTAVAAWAGGAAWVAARRKLWPAIGPGARMRPLAVPIMIGLVMTLLPALTGAMLLFDKTDALRAGDRLEAVLFHVLPLAGLLALQITVWIDLLRLHARLSPTPGRQLIEGVTVSGFDGAAAELRFETEGGSRTVALRNVFFATDELSEDLPTGSGRRGGGHWFRSIAPGGKLIVVGTFAPDQEWLEAQQPGEVALLGVAPSRAPRAALTSALFAESLVLVELGTALTVVSVLIARGVP